MLLVLLSAGCDARRQLEGGLESKDSIELLVLLSRAGIDAERESITSGRREAYRVLVSARDYDRAIELMHEYQLPRRPEEDIEEFTRQKTFTPNSPEVSDFRLDYALALEIERLLEAMPGVVESKALVRSNLKRDLKEPAPPSVSVVIRYVARANNLPFDLEEVRTMVARAVPGLDPKTVQVTASKLSLPGTAGTSFGSDSQSGEDVVPLTQIKPFFVFRIPEEDLAKARWQIVLYLLSFCFAGGVLGAVWGSVATKRKLAKSRRRPSTDPRKSFFLEASFTGDESRAGERLPPGRKESPPSSRV